MIISIYYRDIFKDYSLTCYSKNITIDTYFKSVSYNGNNKFPCFKFNLGYKKFINVFINNKEDLKTMIEKLNKYNLID